MPTALGGLYRVTLVQSVENQEVLNVHYYLNTAGDDTLAQDLFNGFDAQLMALYAAAQHTAVLYSNLKVEPVFGIGLPFEGTPSQADGDVVGTRMAAFNAASIRLLRSTTDVRSGWKRITGITEENTNTNSFTAAYLTILQNLATAMADSILFGGNTFNPVIAQPPFTTKAQLSTWQYTVVREGVAVNRPTTQNSRKTW